MANHIGWFKTNYPGSASINAFVHPANVWAKDAFITEPCWVLDFQSLEKLKDNALKFYNSLKGIPEGKLTSEFLKSKIVENHINSEDLVRLCLKRVAKT